MQVMPEPSRGLGNQDGSAFAFKNFSGIFGPCILLVQTNPGDKSLVVKHMDSTESIFKVTSCNTHIHCQRVVSKVMDNIEYPLFMLQKQIATLHARCDGYIASSDDKKSREEKLFSASKRNVLQNHTKLNVKLFDTFLDKHSSGKVDEHEALLDDLLETRYSLENEALINDVLDTGESFEDDKEEDNCMIEGSWSNKNFTINKTGRSSAVIAKVLPLDTNDKFKVDVTSTIDCAVVISLIAAIDCMKDPGTLKHAGKALGFVMKAAVGAALAVGSQAAYDQLFN